MNAQKNNPSNLITASDLESHVTFLASPLLKGRMNGEEGLEIAGQYLASQAKLIGLKPANSNSYFQPYNILKKTTDPEKTIVQIITNLKDTVRYNTTLTNLIPTGPDDFTLEGEVLFAGYGIKADKYNYNDLENIKPEGKILLIMDRAPMKEDGNDCQFEEPGWVSEMNFQIKLSTLFLTKAKAILIVTDPKSGLNSFEESNTGIAGYLNSKTSLKGDKEERPNPFMSALPKVLFIHRDIADELLKGSGHTLETLQNEIDKSLKSKSFIIDGKKLIVNAVTTTKEVTLNNIAGYVEGRDPVLKNEVIIFSGHYDHIGGSGERINTGADDDASGCAALLSMAKAFQSMKKKPLRSILFLWVSGEEIGLYGSESYTRDPLFPLDKTVADLNMDMIGRVKGIADSTDQTPMTGPNTVFVITGNQSSELLSIADAIDRKSTIDFDYSLSGREHPLQLFSRSDHYNFVEKDIPVLFFSTGLHSDYHTPGDVIEKLDFKKMEMVTRTMFDIGLEVASRKTRLVVDNPYSTWGTKTK
ncbi:MAG: hypothetical protein A2X05_07230 [Bacteroidetes bacterium GWE2_41_25]|nr:MAG: hypothetical protein A2X03_05315 [Bacteroidetes bacterium GWA2_40_15]OFX89762.1 MAG: hypothetical protein A2X06_09955 [Bacteroidetes bacterium GWC2_40_22]OFY00610.1 MAG: hypothetical protein A2X05_07230 [Bacteroidetes bacterium GWE2_41_25]